MSKPGLPRLAILGGGPIGLEAALYAKRAGCPVTLFEQGQIAESVNRWGFARMFTPFGLNVSSLGKQILRDDRSAAKLPADTEYLTGREYREAYLLPEPAVTCSQPQPSAAIDRVVLDAVWMASVIVVRQAEAAKITSDILAFLV